MTEKDELTDMLMSKDVGKNLEEKKQRLSKNSWPR